MILISSYNCNILVFKSFHQVHEKWLTYCNKCSLNFWKDLINLCTGTFHYFNITFTFSVFVRTSDSFEVFDKGSPCLPKRMFSYTFWGGVGICIKFHYNNVTFWCLVFMIWSSYSSRSKSFCFHCRLTVLTLIITFISFNFTLWYQLQVSQENTVHRGFNFYRW